MIRFIPLAIVLGTHTTASASEARGYVTGGISVTPGHAIPVGFGLEAAYAREPYSGNGLTPETFLQVDLRGLRAVRLAAGGRVGWSLARGNDGGTIPSLGLGVALQSDGGHGLHVDAGARQLFDNLGLQLRTDLTLPLLQGHPSRLAVTAAAGPAFGNISHQRLGLLVEGRPLRKDGRALLPSVLVASNLNDVAEHWLERARTEHASVPAFLQLAAELTALGAPRALIGRSLAAAQEELRHARVCYAQVHRATGQPVWVGQMQGWSVRGGTRTRRLHRLVAEAYADGIVGEGNASKRAVARRDGSTDDTVARIEHLIATEEAGHAELAKDVWMWAHRQVSQARPNVRSEMS